MSDPIRISAVSYLNSIPFVYGIRKKMDPGTYRLDLDIPSVCAEKLLNGKVDIGLVPVAVLPLMKEYHIISDHCIGADGKVRSVMLYSHVPLTEIKSILLDEQSRTSVMLTRILAKKFWMIGPQWIAGKEGHEKEIKNDMGGVVIGDRTFVLENKFPFAYDLAEEWKKFTGLPFVFACWVSNRELPAGFKRSFNEALSFGLHDKLKAVKTMQDLPASMTVIMDYLENYISYPFDEHKRKALELFLQHAG